MPLAARYYAFDPNPSAVIKLETVDKPVPGPGNDRTHDLQVLIFYEDFNLYCDDFVSDQVLVKIHYSAINPIDVKIAKGLRPERASSLPFIRGYDIAGRIESVGSNVTLFAVDDPVLTINSKPVEGQLTGGGFAEYVVLSPSVLSRIPEGVTFQQAAAVALVGATALQGLDFVNVGSGTKLLVLGGSTAVGSIVIQLAKLRGAYVVTTSSPRTLEFTQQWGADIIIDYTTEKWDDHEVVRDFDVVYDTVGVEGTFHRAKTPGLLKPDGSFISIANFEAGTDPKAHPPLTFAARFSLVPDTTLQDYLLAQLASGKLRIAIEEEFPFTQEGVSSLFAKQDSNKSLGKNILRIISV